MTGNRTLTGSWAQLWADGVPIYELKRITVNVKAVRQNVQMGVDVDSKIVGLKGEGTMVFYKAYTRFYDIFDQMRSGKDVRMRLIAKLGDPDAADGQVERYAIGNVALGGFPACDWEMGKAAEVEVPFTFTPTDLIKLDGIEVDGE